MLIELVEGADAEERRNALHRFLHAWYERPLEGVDWAAPDGCPELLSWWHSLVLANPVLGGTQNLFEAPEREVVDPFVRYRGDTVEAEPARPLWYFYSENQGVVSWGCEGGVDPAVWARADWPPTGSTAWSRESESLSGFLVGAVLMETMYGAEGGGAWTTMERSDLESFPGIHRLALVPSSPPNARREFWSTPQFIAVTQSTGGPDVEVMFGARSADALSAVGELAHDPYSAGLW